MILTVADLAKAIATLPPSLPVRIECTKTWFDEGPEGACAEQTDTDYADGVEFQGSHVLITCA